MNQSPYYQNKPLLPPNKLFLIMSIFFKLEIIRRKKCWGKKSVFSLIFCIIFQTNYNQNSTFTFSRLQKPHFYKTHFFLEIFPAPSLPLLFPMTPVLKDWIFKKMFQGMFHCFIFICTFINPGDLIQA